MAATRGGARIKIKGIPIMSKIYKKKMYGKISDKNMIILLNKNVLVFQLQLKNKKYYSLIVNAFFSCSFPGNT